MKIHELKNEILRILKSAKKPLSWREIYELSGKKVPRFLPHDIIKELEKDQSLERIEIDGEMKWKMRELDVPKQGLEVRCSVCGEYKDARGFLAIGTWNEHVEVFNTSFFICEDCQRRYLSVESLRWIRKRAGLE